MLQLLCDRGRRDHMRQDYGDFCVKCWITEGWLKDIGLFDDDVS